MVQVSPFKDEFSNFSREQLVSIITPKEIQGEKIINWFRLILIGIFTVFLTVIVSNNNWQLSLGNMFVIGGLILGLCYSLIISFFLNRKRFFSFIKYLSCFFESVIISTVIYSGAYDLYGGPSSVFIVNGYAAYFIFTGLSVLRLSFRASLFSGVLNCLGYALVIFWSQTQGSFDTVYFSKELDATVRFALDNEIIKALFLLIAGLVAGYGTTRNKNLALETLEKQKAIDELNQSLEKKVKDRTSALEEKQEIIDAELDTAREMQMRLLPQQIPEFDHVEIDSTYIPVQKVGGDFFEVLALPRDRLGVFLCDVSGHGVPAAFIAAMVKVLINQIATSFSSPRDVISYLNSHLVEYLTKDFVTAFYAIVDLSNNTMHYCNAGLPAPLHVRSGRSSLLKTRGGVLGTQLSFNYEEKTVALKEKDRIFLYTDGLIEVNNDKGEPFGDERLAECFRERQPLGDTIPSVLGAIQAFAGYTNFQDDVTAIVLELN